MLFPVEGGLTAVRRNLTVRDDAMERFALERMSASGADGRAPRVRLPRGESLGA